MPSLRALGWSAERAEQLSSFSLSNGEPARVAVVERGGWRVVGDGWALPASVAGRLVHHAPSAADLPAVGDWVVVTRDAHHARIHDVLPRTSSFVRKAVGADAPQIVAANIDTVFVVTAVGAEFNARRVERYVAAVVAGGSDPAVVVNKCDLPYDPLDLILALEQAAPGVPVAFVTAASGGDVRELERLVTPGRTVALVGSSGVGKSTLVNRLLGDEVQPTQQVRSGDDKGRHTTTRRELFTTPAGAVVIDTPGMRELGLLDAVDAVESAFDDIEALAAACRFADCAHGGEPGCAVQAALESGELSPSRLASFDKLRREAAYERRRNDVVAAQAEAKRWKDITKRMRAFNRERDR